MSGMMLKTTGRPRGSKSGRVSSVFQEDTPADDDTAAGEHTEIIEFLGSVDGENLMVGARKDSREVDLVIPVPTSRYAKKDGQSGAKSVNMPLLMTNLPQELLGDMEQDEKFKIDMSLRASDIAATSEAYNAVPIAQFGEAMLRGMGWAGPSNDDLNTQEKLSRRGRGVSVLGLGGPGGLPPRMARDGRLGLGATTKPPAKDAKGVKAERENEQWRKRVVEKAKAQALRLGAVVRLRSGEHGGRRAAVVATTGVPGLEMVRVSMETDGALLEISSKEVFAVGLEELRDKPFFLPQREAVTVEAGRSPAHAKATKKRFREANIKQKWEKQATEGAAAKRPRAEQTWICRGIRVRVVSKKVAGAPVYLQKGDVLDTNEKGIAAVRLDDGTVLEGAEQRHLETVLPDRGGECLVLCGPHTGQLARLLEKNKQDETVVVKLQDELDIVVLGMDTVAATAAFRS